MRTALAGGLAGVLLVLGMPSATAGDPDYGRVWRGDGVLRAGCHNYAYQYRVKPPTKVWALETFLVDRRGETIASGVLGYGADAKRGTATFRFCRYNTTPGRFKVRGKLTWYITNSDSKTRWVQPDRFRLRKPS